MLLDVDCSINNGIANILGVNSQINKNEIDVYVNGTLVELLNVDYYKQYKFTSNGIYVVEVNIKKSLTRMEWMFDQCYFVYSISFLPGFDSSKVTSMSYTFVNMNIESIDMKYLDVSSLRRLDYFIHEGYTYKRTDKLDKFIIDHIHIILIIFKLILLHFFNILFLYIFN